VPHTSTAGTSCLPCHCPVLPVPWTSPLWVPPATCHTCLPHTPFRLMQEAGLLTATPGTATLRTCAATSCLLRLYQCTLPACLLRLHILDYHCLGLPGGGCLLPPASLQTLPAARQHCTHLGSALGPVHLYCLPAARHLPSANTTAPACPAALHCLHRAPPAWDPLLHTACHRATPATWACDTIPAYLLGGSPLTSATCCLLVGYLHYLDHTCTSHLPHRTHVPGSLFSYLHYHAPFWWVGGLLHTHLQHTTIYASSLHFATTPLLHLHVHRTDLPPHLSTWDTPATPTCLPPVLVHHLPACLTHLPLGPLHLRTAGTTTCLLPPHLYAASPLWDCWTYLPLFTTLPCLTCRHLYLRGSGIHTFSMVLPRRMYISWIYATATAAAHTDPISCRACRMPPHLLLPQPAHLHAPCWDHHHHCCFPGLRNAYHLTAIPASTCPRHHHSTACLPTRFCYILFSLPLPASLPIPASATACHLGLHRHAVTLAPLLPPPAPHVPACHLHTGVPACLQGTATIPHYLPGQAPPPHYTACLPAPPATHCLLPHHYTSLTLHHACHLPAPPGMQTSSCLPLHHTTTAPPACTSPFSCHGSTTACPYASTVPLQMPLALPAHLTVHCHTAL